DGWWPEAFDGSNGWAVGDRRIYGNQDYQDFMEAIPPNMHHLPVYITETNQHIPWRNQDSGWVRNAYADINWWNQQPGRQRIRALILYRWPKKDKWYIEGKWGVIEDFKQALDHEYRWDIVAPPEPEPQRERYFEPTGQWVRGIFLDFYERYGLDITGYPITPEFVDPESGLKTQYFQRVVLEEWNGQPRLKLAGTMAYEAKRRIDALQQQVDELRRRLSSAGHVAAPSIEDITHSLPRDNAGFKQRPEDRIGYLVIHHTGVGKDIDVVRIAKAHRKRGWPGIVYHFLIDTQGRIYQTNPLTEAVDDQQMWAAEAVGIAFAGNFTEAIPTEAQIEAGAQLCAWLLQRYGLSSNRIVGLGEVITTQSPGRQWLEGQHWKDMLLVRTQAVLDSAPSNGDSARLQQEIQNLQVQVQQLQAQVIQLQAENERLRSSVGGGRIAPPPIVNIVDQLPRDPEHMTQRPLDEIRYLVINHTAVAPSVGAARVAEAHRSRWPGILHQYFITADGTIQQTEPLDEVVDGTQPWIHQGVHICFAGDFTVEVPTEAQLERMLADAPSDVGKMVVADAVFSMDGDIIDFPK
ncbi:MAG TPA: hypothetical protein EYP04_09515, partial [Anaerolineae bacterium]|nr:hypothetical protein [Anaerolineae bacterium]